MNYLSCRTLIVFILLSVIYIDTDAATWTMIFERVSFNGKLLERRFIDTESLSRNDFSTNIQYTIRVEEYWEAKIRSNITRTVVVNCQDRSRFEVVSESDLTLKPFKSVFAETSIGNEVDFACEKSKFSRSKTSSANENQTAPNPETLPKARAPSTGSGFVVSKNRVLTSAHVVAECQKIEIRQGAVKRSGSIISTDERTDLALISFDQVSMMIPYIRNSAILGEDVMVAGYPLAGLLGSELIVTTGQVNSLAGIRNDSTLLQVSAPVQPGNSGGPLVDRNGNIVGVVVSKLNVERVSKLTGDFAQNINFAVKPEIIRLFLSANGIEQTIPKKLKRLENQDIAQRAKEFVVQIVCN